jgi:hypothetical protein
MKGNPPCFGFPNIFLGYEKDVPSLQETLYTHWAATVLGKASTNNVKKFVEKRDKVEKLIEVMYGAFTIGKKILRRTTKSLEYLKFSSIKENKL